MHCLPEGLALVHCRALVLPTGELEFEVRDRTCRACEERPHWSLVPSPQAARVPGEVALPLMDAVCLRAEAGGLPESWSGPGRHSGGGAVILDEKQVGYTVFCHV